MNKYKEVLKELAKQRKVFTFDEIAKTYGIDEKELKELLGKLEKEGYLIVGELFGEENSNVYLPIDVNDEELDKIRIIEIRGELHLVAIWRTKAGYKVENMYLGKLSKIIREGFSKAIQILNEKNKVVFETYR
jgi:DNA-directed RNA polymerase specialized sigma subunit